MPSTALPGHSVLSSINCYPRTQSCDFHWVRVRVRCIHSRGEIGREDLLSDGRTRSLLVLSIIKEVFMLTTQWNGDFSPFLVEREKGELLDEI